MFEDEIRVYVENTSDREVRWNAAGRLYTLAAGEVKPMHPAIFGIGVQNTTPAGKPPVLKQANENEGTLRHARNQAAQASREEEEARELLSKLQKRRKEAEAQLAAVESLSAPEIEEEPPGEGEDSPAPKKPGRPPKAK